MSAPTVMLRLGRRHANDADHQQCCRHGQQRNVPRPGHGWVGLVLGISQRVFPTSTHHKRDGSTFGVGRVPGSQVLDRLTSSQGTKVGETETQRLVSTGRGCGPRGHGATVGDQAQRILRFYSGQPTKRNYPRAPHVDDNHPVALHNDGRMPVEQPRSEAHQGEQGTVVQSPRDIGAKDESAYGCQHQGNDDNGQNATKTGAKGSRGLLHAASMTHARGGGADGIAA